MEKDGWLAGAPLVTLGETGTGRLDADNGRPTTRTQGWGRSMRACLLRWGDSGAAVMAQRAFQARPIL